MDAPFCVWDTQVQRLDLVDRTELSGEHCVEPRARDVPLVLIGRNDRAARFEERAVAPRTVADADRSGRDREIRGREHGWLAVEEREDLAPACIHHRDRAGS